MPLFHEDLPFWVCTWPRRAFEVEKPGIFKVPSRSFVEASQANQYLEEFSISNRANSKWNPQQDELQVTWLLSVLGLLVAWPLVVEICKARYSRPFSVSLLKHLNQLGICANFRFHVSSRPVWGEGTYLNPFHRKHGLRYVTSPQTGRWRHVESKIWANTELVEMLQQRNRKGPRVSSFAAFNNQRSRDQKPNFAKGFNINPLWSKTKCLELQQVVSTKPECRDHKMSSFRWLW
jgi:hypothetical protein